MVNYIFLDIDGVLNSKRTKARAPYDCMGIGKNHLNVLKTIVEKTNGNIVLISDWRLSFLPNDHMPKMADYIAKKLHSVDLQFELASYNHQYEIRAKEIEKWINTHPTKGYIILDDNDNRWYRIPEVESHWIHTDYKKGLTEDHIEEAIRKMQEPVLPFNTDI